MSLLYCRGTMSALWNSKPSLDSAAHIVMSLPLWGLYVWDGGWGPSLWAFISVMGGCVCVSHTGGRWGLWGSGGVWVRVCVGVCVFVFVCVSVFVCVCVCVCEIAE